MTLLTIISAVLLLEALALLRVLALAERHRTKAAELDAQLKARGAEVYVGHRVVVQTKDGQTLDGIMAEVYADHYRLVSGKYLVGGQATVLAGDELIAIDNVSWVQRPGGPRRLEAAPAPDAGRAAKDAALERRSAALDAAEDAHAERTGTVAGA